MPTEESIKRTTFNLIERARRRRELLATGQFTENGGTTWLKLNDTKYMLGVIKGGWLSLLITGWHHISFEEVFESLPKERQIALSFHLDLLLEKP